MHSKPLESIAIVSHDFDALREMLFTADGHENFAVLFCGISRSATARRWLVREIWPAPLSAYKERLPYHLEISPSFLNSVVSHSLSRGLNPVIVHSHPAPGPARYSPSDDYGERRLLPVLQQLLPKAIPASMLLTEDDAAGRVQVGVRLTPLDTIDVRGLKSRRFRASKEKGTRKLEAYDRQLRAFGEAGQERLGSLRVGIVGVGGTGSLVAEQMIRLGVDDLTLVDTDVVEESNLSRMSGTTWSDATRRRPKVEVIAGHLRRIRSTTKIAQLAESVIRQPVLEELRDCDVVFNCTDNHLSRAIINRFAYQYLVPVVDMGIRLDARSGTVSAVGGRVTLVGPGFACLRCSGHVDPEQVRAESLSPEQRERLAREGYMQGADEPAPAVVSLNATIAGLAVTSGMGLFVNLVGQDPPADTIYDATRTSVFAISQRHEDNCEICSPVTGLKALGDHQIMSAYG